jgi:hypothetical protein
LAHPVATRYKALYEIFADDQFEHRIAAGTVDKRPLLSRRQIVGEAPGQRHRAQHYPCLHQLANPAPKRLRRSNQPDQRKGRHHAEGDQHFDVERDTDQRGGEQQETRSAGLDRAAQLARTARGSRQARPKPAATAR